MIRFTEHDKYSHNTHDNDTEYGIWIREVVRGNLFLWPNAGQHLEKTCKDLNFTLLITCSDNKKKTINIFTKVKATKVLLRLYCSRDHAG